MADNPKTAEGRAKMLRDSLKQRANADDSHEVQTWSQTIDEIRRMQRDAGDE